MLSNVLCKLRFKLPRELPFDGQIKGNGMTVEWLMEFKMGV